MYIKFVIHPEIQMYTQTHKELILKHNKIKHNQIIYTSTGHAVRKHVVVATSYL